MHGKTSQMEKVFTFLVFLISYLLVTFAAVGIVLSWLEWSNQYPFFVRSDLYHFFVLGLLLFPSALSWYFYEIFEYSGWMMFIGYCAYIVIALYATFAGNRRVAIILYGIFLLLLMANLISIIRFIYVDTHFYQY
jgi:hypothetical protein